jgi:hypothetical protein
MMQLLISSLRFGVNEGRILMRPATGLQSNNSLQQLSSCDCIAIRESNSGQISISSSGVHGASQVVIMVVSGRAIMPAQEWRSRRLPPGMIETSCTLRFGNMYRLLSFDGGGSKERVAWVQVHAPTPGRRLLASKGPKFDFSCRHSCSPGRAARNPPRSSRSAHFGRASGPVFEPRRNNRPLNTPNHNTSPLTP